MDAEAIRAFAKRDRGAVAALKVRAVAELFESGGSAATFEAARALYEHVRSVRPDWPTERDRADDLRDHVRLKALLDAARDAFAAR